MFVNVITPKALGRKYIILFHLKVVYATISKLCYDVIVCILYSPMLCILNCLLLKIYLICDANTVIHHTCIQCVYDNRRYYILCILTRQTKRELKINVRHTQDRVELSGWGSGICHIKYSLHSTSGMDRCIYCLKICMDTMCTSSCNS